MLFKLAKYITLFILILMLLPVGFFLWFELTFDPTKLPENYGKVNSQLFESSGTNQPLIVFFGGSEGGNSMAKERNRAERQLYVNNGYAVLAIGYFGMKGLPSQLDRISLNGIYDEIERHVEHENIDANCIIVAGGSKGAELALTLASKYPKIKSAVSLAGSHVVFAGTSPFTDGKASSFMFNNKQVSFVPFTKSMIPSLIAGDFRGAYEVLLKNEEHIAQALIEVEKIQGPVLMISGEKDHVWPSQEMSDEVVKRLKAHNFAHAYQHIKVPNANHFRPQSDFHHEVIDFLNTHVTPICQQHSAD